MKILSLVTLLLAFSAQAAKWSIDDTHSTARFKVRHLMVSNVSGEITAFKGGIELDEKSNELKEVDVTLSAATINTQNTKRDEHLKGADFFDTAKHPNITFKSKKITKGKDGKYSIAGDLTIRGVTKPATFTNAEVTSAVKDPWGNTRRGFSAATKINRKDYGIVWNKNLDGGGLAVGEEVSVEVEGEMTAPTEKKS